MDEPVNQVNRPDAHEAGAYLRALDASTEAVAITRVADTTFAYVNKAFLQLSGFERDEVIGRPALELDVWADVGDRDAIVAALAEAPATGWHPVLFRNKLGQLIRTEVSAELVEMGGEPCVLTLARDVTETTRLGERVEVLAAIVESSSDAIIGQDLDGIIVSWNAGAEQMFGYPAAEAVGRSMAIVVPSEKAGEFTAILDAIAEGTPVTELETVRRRKDGTLIDVSIRVSPIRDSEGRVTGASAIDRDITHRKRAEEQIRQTELQYRSLVERIPAVTYVDAIDRSSSTIYVSPQVEGLLGYPATEWDADPDLWIRLLHEEDRERVVAEHERTNRTGEPFAMEYRMLHRDGSDVWVRDEAILVRDAEGKPRFWQGVLLNITERKRAEEDIAYRAFHDSLTGLPNRDMVAEVLDLALARAERATLAVALLFVDLDDFRLVNDRFGHPGGDVVLREAAARMRRAARATDVIGRVGGDEFLVVVADLDRIPSDGAEGVARAVAGRICEELARPFTVQREALTLGATAGIALYPKDAGTSTELVAAADAAMYRNKSTR